MAIAETCAGKVEGLERDGVHVFRGIPFAAPPVGERRWQPPAPREPWTGVRDATHSGAVCAQPPFVLEQITGGTPPRQSEDCLFLNVWTPGLDDARRPVMVWIHGGAFVNGSGSTPWYDGSRFARNGDVVVVTINYRLGPFGFLHLAELFGERFAGSGNAGLLDQVAALEWVRDNITAFGGDPGNVTIFGESAGAGSVGTLLGLPAAAGLFHGAIAQSGAASWCATPERAASVARRVVEDLGVEPGDADALLTCPADRVVGAVAALEAELGHLALPFQPVADEVVLPEPPLDAVAAGSAAGIRLLLGTNAEEMTLFSLADAKLAQLDDARLLRRARRLHPRGEELLDAYRAAHPEETAAGLWLAMSGDSLFRVPAIRLAERQHGHAAVYKYLFTWRSTAFGGLLGASHALDIPFVFDNLHQAGVEVFTGDGPERPRLAEAMHRAWIAFAHRGDPAHPGLPEWPAYEPGRRATMRFDVPCELLHDPGSEIRQAWQALS